MKPKTNSDTTPKLYIGLDVHKEQTSVAVADPGAQGEVRSHGSITTSLPGIEKLLRRLGHRYAGAATWSEAHKSRVPVLGFKCLFNNKKGPVTQMSYKYATCNENGGGETSTSTASGVTTAVFTDLLGRSSKTVSSANGTTTYAYSSHPQAGTEPQPVGLSSCRTFGPSEVLDHLLITLCKIRDLRLLDQDV